MTSMYSSVWSRLVLMCAMDWTGFSLDAELFPGLDETGIAIDSIGYHYDLLYV